MVAKALIHRHVSNFFEVCSRCRKVFRGAHWRIGVDRRSGVIVCNICAPSREAIERLEVQS